MKFLNKYLLRGTPSLLLPLGAGFVMASSSDLRAALGMGVAVLLVTLLSSVLISLIKKFVPEYTHLPIFILIVTGFVSLIDMLMQAYVPEVVSMLGVHLAALAVSAVVFRETEEVAEVKSVGETTISAICTGLFFTVVMLVCALFREFIGNGSLWGFEIGFMKDFKVSAIAGAFGGYLVLAIVLAVIRKLVELKCENKEEC